MRGEVKTVARDVTASEFRRRFPLGSVSRVAVIDGEERYAGIVTTAAAFAKGVADDAMIETLARVQDVWLAPAMHIGEVMARFAAQSDELVILGEERHILGILTETFVRRRYSDELEKAQRDLFGER